MVRDRRRDDFDVCGDLLSALRQVARSTDNISYRCYTVIDRSF